MNSINGINTYNSYSQKEIKTNDKTQDTQQSQKQENTEGISTLNSKASQAIASMYKPINIQRPINKIIKTEIPGQKVLITSDFENPEKVIVTFFNDGHPTKPFKTDINSLSDYGLSLSD